MYNPCFSRIVKASSPKLNIIVAIGGVTIHLTMLVNILPTVNIDYANVACSVSMYMHHVCMYVCNHDNMTTTMYA